MRGDGFDCGALYCYRKHRNAGEFCFPDQGPWYCGQTDPLCPGHAGSGPEHRHGTGALRLYGSLMRERRSSTGLARSVVRILRESALAQIEFELYGDTVSGRDFMDVACLVETGAVTVRRLGVGALGGSRAEYSQSVNVMEVELRSWSVAEKAAIVHEAVHAIADYRAGGLVDAVEHEAVAFVAGAWYYRTQSVSAPGRGGLRGKPRIAWWKRCIGEGRRKERTFAPCCRKCGAPIPGSTPSTAWMGRLRVRTRNRGMNLGGEGGMARVGGEGVRANGAGGRAAVGGKCFPGGCRRRGG
ncbi:MAG: hypothetical protein U5J83_14540 [Bryobacterales bacterium]|nr:hypothetical protein [Bryobacterales bacterium]